MTVQPQTLQETARRLGISPEALEQYFALKAAEVMPRAKDDSANPPQTLKPRRQRK